MGWGKRMEEPAEQSASDDSTNGVFLSNSTLANRVSHTSFIGWFVEASKND
jgi:hypothetical protein